MSIVKRAKKIARSFLKIARIEERKMAFYRKY
jgi:hypothetical protein